MNPEIQLDAAAESILRDLRAMFAPHGNVNAVQLNAPEIAEEFRPASVKDVDLHSVPKPSHKWAFGVECGTAQGDARLVAMVFTGFSRLKEFYAKNPALHGTLVTCWHGAAAIWLRATGRIPQNFAADGVWWCASGTIPVGCPKRPAETFLSQPGEIKQVDFGKLVWSEQQLEAVERVFLEMEVGPRFRRGPRGRRLLNSAHWAKYYSGLMQITYDSDRNSFAWTDPIGGPPVWHSEDDSLRLLAELLQVAAKSCGGEFPEGELRPVRVRQILGRIKLLNTRARASDSEVLDAFLAKRVLRMPDKDASSQEIRASFIAFCQGLGRAPCSAARFYRPLKAKLHQLGIDQRHDILRCGKEVRGYSGLSLVPGAVVKKTDSADLKDGTDGA